MKDSICTWKDGTYRQGLLAEGQGMLFANPAGEIELTDAELETISGALGASVPSMDEDRNGITDPNTVYEGDKQNNSYGVLPIIQTVGPINSIIPPVRLF